MKPLLIILITFAFCVGALYAPHHRRRANSFFACTLAEIYKDVFGSLDSLASARAGTYVSFVLAALFASGYPAMLVLMIWWLRPGSGAGGAGALFVLGGLLALAGTAANFIGMVVSHLTIGFGASSGATADQTPFLFAIPIFQGLFAFGSLAIGFSSTCASLADRWVIA
jgi:hypothetical protein